MIKFQESSVINRPVEAVFAFATDPEKSHLWQTENVVAEKSLAGDPQGKGKLIKTVKGLGMRMEITQEILEFELNRKMVSRMTVGRKIGNLSATGIWMFEPVTDGTRVTFGWEVMLGGLFKLTTPVFAPLARRTLRHDLANLKKELEGTA